MASGHDAPPSANAMSDSRSSYSLSKDHDTYWRQTKRPINNVAMIVPLLAFFHISSAFCPSELLAPQLIGKALSYFGATANFLPPLLIVAVLLGRHAAQKQSWTIQPKALAGMCGESVFWTIPLVVMSFLTGGVVASSLTGGDRSIFFELVTGVGAGVYEEFVFRLVFISLVMLVFEDILEFRGKIVPVLTVIVGACLFSALHFDFMGVDGLEFRWSSFIVLAAAGTLWGVLYIFRGLGIAVGSHIVWNVYAAAAGAMI